MARTMTRWFLLALLASGSFALVACGDDDDDDSTGDGDADADSDSDSDADGDGDGDGDADADADGDGDGACDAAAVAAEYDIPDDDPDGGEMSVNAIAGHCGVPCIFQQGMADGCVSDCMVAATGGAIDAACGDCFEGSAYCTGTNCGLRCADAASADCFACQCGDNDASVNCRDEFYACAGVPNTMPCP